MPREQREDVRDDEALDDPLPGDIGKNDQANPEPGGLVLKALELGARPCENQHESPVGGRRDRVHERVEALFRREPGDREDCDVLRGEPHFEPHRLSVRHQAIGLAPERRHIDRVGEQ